MKRARKQNEEVRMSMQSSGRTPTTDLWSYRDTTFTQNNLTGYKVEARDGGIGKIDESTTDVGNSCIVVDTGPWILGKKVMIPAGVINDIDHDTETVFVDRTKDEIKNAPEYDESRFQDEGYRGELGTYYGSGPGV
jgi:hypothetical protein